jgi:hypothetical protein
LALRYPHAALPAAEAFDEIAVAEELERVQRHSELEEVQPLEVQPEERAVEPELAAELELLELPRLSVPA